MIGNIYVSHWDRYDLKQGNIWHNFKITNQTLSVVILLLLSGTPTMENHPVDKIEPGNNSHDDIDYNSTLSGKTKPIKSVVTTPENRNK